MGITDFNLGKIISHKFERQNGGKLLVTYVKYWDDNNAIYYACKVDKNEDGGASESGYWYEVSADDYRLSDGAEITHD